MGRKIFVSYKYADNEVKNISGSYYPADTVRTYVDELSEILKEDNIYKGEEDDEDLSDLEEDTIWEKLKNRVYDSSVTIVMISKNMKESFKEDKNQWIPREISYSLKEISRVNQSGDSVTSKTNALLGVILPDSSGNYSYYYNQRTCCDDGCNSYTTSFLFDILKNNMFNKKDAEPNECSTGSKIYTGYPSYLINATWDNFISDPDKYIDRACNIQDNVDEYNVAKEV